MTASTNRLVLLVALGLLLVVAQSATAQPPTPSGPADPAGAAATSPEPIRALATRVAIAEADLDPAEVHAAVERELGLALGRAGEAETNVIEVEVRGAAARVTFIGAEGRRTERQIELPREPLRAIETLALLAGNLARDEAAELVAGLQARQRAEDAVQIEELAEASGVAAQPKPSPELPPAESSPPVASAPAKPEDEPQASQRLELPLASANLTLFHPLALNPHIHRQRTALEVGLLYSRVGGVDAFAFNPLVTNVERDVLGAVVAGVAERIGGDTQGVVLSGVGGIAGGDAEGATLSGVFRWRAGRMAGAQIAGLLARSSELSGVQLSSMNWLGAGEGLQLGAVNVAGELSGVQTAAVNVGGDIGGAQLGAVNVAGRVRGVQIGLINVADEIDGAPIGLLSITGDLHLQAVTWVSTTTPFNAGVRLRNGYVYNIIHAGYDPDANNTLTSLGTFIGVQLESEPWSLNLDVGWESDTEADQNSEFDDGVRTRALIAAKVLPGIEVFAGGGLQLRITESTSSPDYEPELDVGLQLF